ncbi:hypothetical protein ES705_12984 [subsurface metagenome]
MGRVAVHPARPPPNTKLRTNHDSLYGGQAGRVVRPDPPGLLRVTGQEEVKDLADTGFQECCLHLPLHLHAALVVRLRHGHVVESTHLNS